VALKLTFYEAQERKWDKDQIRLSLIFTALTSTLGLPMGLPIPTTIPRNQLPFSKQQPLMTTFVGIEMLPPLPKYTRQEKVIPTDGPNPYDHKYRTQVDTWKIEGGKYISVSKELGYLVKIKVYPPRKSYPDRRAQPI
jgi:hypothetical protein